VNNDDDVLEEIAGSILDGTPVDWSRLESPGSPTDPALVLQLKTLATLGAVGGTLDAGAPGQGAWGHLRVLECIGRGASGEVYRAWDTRLDREVALKLMSVDTPASAQPSSLIEEGRLLARVRHPNVATIYGAERIGGRIGLWMELVKGKTLEEAVAGGKRFAPAEVVTLGREICSAVSAVHAAGVIHRDIKAQNVMATDSGRVVLMDFGTGLEKTSGLESVAGTPLYLAPEVLRGEMATVQSDIYGVGVLLYRLLTHTFPVRAQTLDDLGRAHAAGERTSVRAARSGVPKRLARVIERAIDSDPGRRYQSAEAMAADLAAVGRSSSTVRTAMAAAAAVAVAATAWAAWDLRWRQPRQTDTTAPIAAGFTTAASAATTLAVLPFTNASGSGDADYFVDGLTNEITRRLASVQGLQVRAHGSAATFKGKPRDLKTIAEQLGVGYVVEGTVRYDDTRLVVDAQLVRVAGDAPVWSKHFDTPKQDVFAVQDEISRAVASTLQRSLEFSGRRQQTTLAVYEQYLRARDALDKGGTNRASQAARLFEQVIASDPSFAPGHAGLAEAYGWLSMSFDGLDARRANVLMRQAATKALALDPLSPEAHAALGMTYARERNWDAAQRSFAHAIRLNPTLTHIHRRYTVTTLLPLGKSAEAEQLLEEALRSDPLSPEVRRELATAQYVGGRCAEAVVNLERLRITHRQLPFVDLFFARALTCAGRLEEALPIWDSRSGVGWEHWAAAAYVKAGRRAEVERMAIRQAEPFQEAMIYAALGDKDRTFDALNRSVDNWAHRITLHLQFPEMAFLRGDPRLDALRTRLGLP
jgi:serine/threonine-protein kinase